ncbi:hypothetical protein TGAM01_v202398 [Trichoderma gamsii]|uniref:Uncharacterized protein n=1 Tax=Trichoderma gamsii TaxID=398673 RepID=A0A2P4ZWA8_9HYPO|nr:hypothetical protein TGAM01_v202398 [Trichoderma gamsii]PON28551.1 hypothetical protein TGAM01_v202398 [Trichoderma gamsii]
MEAHVASMLPPRMPHWVIKGIQVLCRPSRCLDLLQASLSPPYYIVEMRKDVCHQAPVLQKYLGFDFHQSQTTCSGSNNIKTVITANPPPLGALQELAGLGLVSAPSL